MTGMPMGEIFLNANETDKKTLDLYSLKPENAPLYLLHTGKGPNRFSSLQLRTCAHVLFQ
jgi:hypothetical protein